MGPLWQEIKANSRVFCLNRSGKCINNSRKLENLTMELDMAKPKFYLQYPIVLLLWVIHFTLFFKVTFVRKIQMTARVSHV